jgi:3,4-dihydroxy 2-butanone 4-phosphate synthase / GTP cyclohydrolase II
LPDRRRSEKLVYRLAEANLPTRFGPGRIIAYGVKYEDQQPIAILLGDPASRPEPLVRLHSACFTGDLLSSLRCDCGDQLQLAMQMIGQEGAGVLVYLPQEGRGIGLIEKIRAYSLQDRGMDTVEANIALGYPADLRDYGIGLQILQDLGLTKVRLLTNNPKKIDAFVIHGHGLEVVDQVPIIASEASERTRYMAAKRDLMGHLLPTAAAGSEKPVPGQNGPRSD